VDVSGVSLQLLIRPGAVLDGQQRADHCANETHENEPGPGFTRRSFSIDAGVKKEKIRPDETVCFKLSTIPCPRNRKKPWKKFSRHSAFKPRSRNINWRRAFCST